MMKRRRRLLSLVLALVLALGIAVPALAVGNTPAVTRGQEVYRVYNPGNDNHLYTMDIKERDNLVKGGWNYEGILCYSAGSDGVPLYRVFNPYVTLNPHHYTDSLEECAFLESNGWKVEGISWYGLE